MKSLAMTVNLHDDPEVIAKYKEYHAAVWPEVLSALREVGCIDMKIYLIGNQLFMYCNVEDDFNPAEDFPKYLDIDPICQKWEDLMGTYQVPHPLAGEGEKWTEIEEVFDLQAQL